MTAASVDDQVRRDLACGGRGHERLVGQGRPAQRRQHVDLAAGQVGRDGAAQLDVGVDVFARDAAHAAAGGAETHDVAVLENAPRDRAAVDTGAVARESEVHDVDVRATPDKLGVQPGDAGLVES